MTPTLLRRLAGPFLTVLAASLVLAACDGTNAFVTPPGDDDDGGGTPGQTDATPPALLLVMPKHDTSTVAPGDSLYFEARVSDNVALDSVIFEAFALRGDPELGTQTRVNRFTPKVALLRPASGVLKADTVRRYLYAVAGDSTNERIFAVATVIDTAGNRTADTVRVIAGGPRVSILSPAPGAEFTGGTEIRVRVQASDATNLIRSVRLSASGRPVVNFDVTVTPTTPVAAFDSTLVISLPADSGTLTLTASAVSGADVPAVGIPVTVKVLPPRTDAQAPRVTFSVDVDARAELDDSIAVQVSATDDTRVDSVGVTVLAFRRTPTSETLLGVLQGRLPGPAGTFRFAYAQLALTGLDTATVSLEVTAYAVDPNRNCGAATATGAALAQPCATGTGGARVSATGPGRLFTVFVARGLSVAVPNPGDVLADLIADSQRVYLSNHTRNRVETLPLGALAYGASIRVGSEPWGLALGRFRDSLYVANSGGTNMSVIPLAGPGALREAEDRRIFTRNERLFSVNFAPTDGKVSGVFLHDYSDRPQFIAQASNGLLVYSTKPTAAARDGTVRIYDPRKLRSEIFTGYLDRHTQGKAIVVNADSAFRIPGDSMLVCPRRRFGDAADPGCVRGTAYDVSSLLTALRAEPANAAGGRWDTRLDIGADVDSVGFADTTFVAVSGDHDFVAVGEGARQANARIPLFAAEGDSLVLRGDVRDLISNTAERVIGLGLNFDGSLGIARGNAAYLFTDAARLQGSVASGSPSGGVAMHPEGSGYPTGPFRLAFVSGIDAKGPYIDVIDTFGFGRVNRLYIRDPVVGALAVAPRAAGDPANVALRLYALTAGGVVSLQVTTADLTLSP